MSTETRAEERYRSSFERNPVGIYRTTLEGRILDCNDACARLFGYENRAQFLERAASDFYFDGADRQHVIATLREKQAIKNLQLRLKRQDGSAIWLLENAILISSEDGQPDVLEGTLIDITTLKQAEEKLQIQRAHFGHLFEYSPEAIATLDTQFRIQQVNQEFTRLFGFTPEEAYGKDINQLTVPAERKEEGEVIYEQMRKGHKVNVEA